MSSELVLNPIQPFGDTQEELLSAINNELDLVEDYTRDCNSLGAAVFLGPNGISTDSSFSIVAKTANYTTVATDRYILCNASGGAFTVTLLAPTSGLRQVIKKVAADTTSNTVTVTGGSYTIDGVTSWKLTMPRSAIEIVADGSVWHIIGVINGVN